METGQGARSRAAQGGYRALLDGEVSKAEEREVMGESIARLLCLGS